MPALSCVVDSVIEWSPAWIIGASETQTDLPSILVIWTLIELALIKWNDNAVEALLGFG